MKFKFNISKLSNQFFFISNLSEWHFSCRKEYNKNWRAGLPAFTSEQEETLKLFSEALKKYEKYKRGINFPIFEKTISGGNIKSVTRGMSDKRRTTVENTFVLFKDYFEQLWQEAILRLKDFTISVEGVESKTEIKNALEIIEAYFGKPIGGKNKIIVEVYLLMAPKGRWGGGGANIGPNRVTLEIGDMSDTGNNWISRILLHEVTHLCYQKRFKKLMSNFIKTLSVKSYKTFATVIFFENLDTVLKELITSSIIGEGIVDSLIFKIPIKERLKLDITKLDWSQRSLSSLVRKSASLALFGLNEEYLKDKKPIDMNYIRQAFEFLQKFEQKYKKGAIQELAYL